MTCNFTEPLFLSLLTYIAGLLTMAVIYESKKL